MVAVEVGATGVVLRFCPAYVHHWENSSRGWRGEGRAQNAEMVIGNASVVGRPGGAVNEVAGGSLKVGADQFDNLVPVPMDTRALVHCRLEFMNAEALVVDGQSVSIRLVGKAEFVEDLPPESAPGRDAV
jgi:hypothetical protein